MALKMKRCILAGLKKKCFVGVLFCSVGLMSMLQGADKVSSQIAQGMAELRQNRLEVGPFGVPQVWGRADENGGNASLAATKHHLIRLHNAVNELRVQLFTFGNHDLCALQSALEGHPNAYQEQTVDHLYDMLGAIPGHHRRHHRDFRKTLVARFTGHDQQIAVHDNRLNELQAQNTQLRGELTSLCEQYSTQMISIFERLRVMEAKLVAVEQENTVLKAENVVIKNEQAEQKRQKRGRFQNRI